MLNGQLQLVRTGFSITESVGLGRWTHGHGCGSQFLLEETFPQRTLRSQIWGKKHTYVIIKKYSIGPFFVDSMLDFKVWTMKTGCFFFKCRLSWFFWGQFENLLDSSTPKITLTTWTQRIFRVERSSTIKPNGDDPQKAGKGLSWNYPPPSNSDHQDYYIFNRESL